MASHSQKRRRQQVDADEHAVSRLAELVRGSDNSVAPREPPRLPKPPPSPAFDPALLARLAEQARLSAAAEAEPPPPPPPPQPAPPPEVSVSINQAALAHSSAIHASAQAASVAAQVSSKSVEGRGGHTATGPTRGAKRKSEDEVVSSSGAAIAVETSATSRTSSAPAASAATMTTRSTSSATPARTSTSMAVGFALPFRPKLR